MEDKNKKVDELLQLLGNEISESRFNEMKHYDEENDERKTVEPKKHIRSYKTFLKVCCIIPVSYTHLASIKAQPKNNSEKH